jgi:hypothetical protein
MRLIRSGLRDCYCVVVVVEEELEPEPEPKLEPVLELVPVLDDEVLLELYNCSMIGS